MRAPAWLVLAGTIACSPAPANHRITTQALQFTPASLSVAPGDTISFVNDDIVPHNATVSDSTWASGSIDPGDAFQVVIEQTGTYRYTCTYHPGMSGQIVVR